MTETRFRSASVDRQKHRRVERLTIRRREPWRFFGATQPEIWTDCRFRTESRSPRFTFFFFCEFHPYGARESRPPRAVRSTNLFVRRPVPSISLPATDSFAPPPRFFALSLCPPLAVLACRVSPAPASSSRTGFTTDAVYFVSLPAVQTAPTHRREQLVFPPLSCA